MLADGAAAEHEVAEPAEVAQRDGDAAVRKREPGPVDGDEGVVLGADPRPQLVGEKLVVAAPVALSSTQARTSVVAEQYWNDCRGPRCGSGREGSRTSSPGLRSGAASSRRRGPGPGRPIRIGVVLVELERRGHVQQLRRRSRRRRRSPRAPGRRSRRDSPRSTAPDSASVPARTPQRDFETEWSTCRVAGRMPLK